jgi:hypothetical protein
MILPVTVLLAPFLAEAFHRCRGPGLAAVNTVALTWSAAIALALALVPAWRYQNLDGRATLLQAAGALLGLDLARFWPSLIAPTPWTWAVLALGALALLGATLGAGRRFARPAPGWGAGAVWLGPRAGLGLVAALALAWIAAAALVPTWVVEAAAMRSTGGRQYQAREDSRARWAMTVDGELAERIVTWAGLTEVVVVAGSYTTTEAPPRLVVLLDDRPVAAWALPAGSGRWTRGEYTARVPTRFAHPRLRVRLAGLVDDAARGRFEHAYVERVHLRWLGGAP